MKTLHRTKGIDHDLVVTREGRKITLWAGPGIRYTVIDLEAPHLPGLEYARNTLLALAFNPKASSFLILGLGGGSIAGMLGAARPDASIDAVEIDPAVPELARRFFFSGDRPRLRVHLDDAASYVASCQKRYDIVILDAYTGDAFPVQCTARRFFEHVRERLVPEGLLVINWMPGGQEHYRRLIANLQASIDHVWLLHGTGSRNILVFAALRRQSRNELVAAAGKLGTELPFGSELVSLARRVKPYKAPKP